MTLVSEICTRALHRNNTIAAGETPTASDIEVTLDALNDMMFAWEIDDVRIEHQGFELTDTFVFFVPPRLSDRQRSGNARRPLRQLVYEGTWNAATNAPALRSRSGDEGALFRVTTAGTTNVDGLSSWAVNDFAMFDGDQWHKGQSSRPFHGAVIALLAVRMATEFGDQIPPELARAASQGWRRISRPWLEPYEQRQDLALLLTSTSRYYVSTDQEDFKRDARDSGTDTPVSPPTQESNFLLLNDQGDRLLLNPGGDRMLTE